MKKNLLSLVVIAAVASASISITGCTKDTYEQASAAKSEAQSLQTKMQELTSQISTTSNSLNTLVANTETDPTEHYKAFVAAIDKFNSLDKSVENGVTSFLGSVQKNFDLRRANLSAIADSTLRKKTQSQLDDDTKNIKSITDTFEEARQALAAYQNNLTDANNYLKAANLNSAGLKGAQSFAKKTTSLGKDAISELEDVIKAVNKAIDALAPSDAQPAAATK